MTPPSGYDFNNHVRIHFKADVRRLLYKLHAETRWLTYFLVLKMLVLRAQKELSAEILSEWS